MVKKVSMVKKPLKCVIADVVALPGAGRKWKERRRGAASGVGQRRRVALFFSPGSLVLCKEVYHA
jgi:hypothetical protein